MILNTFSARLAVASPAAPASTRQRELEAGRLVLRAVAASDPFLARRAADEAYALAASPARRGLVRAADALLAGDRPGAWAGLIAYGSVLERHGLPAEASAIYQGVLAGHGADPRVALHSGRAARKAGDREGALRLYGVASAEAAGDRALELLAEIGRALLSDDAIDALDAVARAARHDRQWEAFAIAREERARLNRAAGQARAAIRDLAAAVRRYSDATDRIRVLHALADLLSARGDLLGAREALLAALGMARPSTRAHTVQRMRTVARALGDELELRRSRGQGTPALVTLLPPRSSMAREVPSLAPRLRRFRTS